MSTSPALYAGYAFDLDGTVYIGDELLPGAAETIAELRAAGSRVVFVTNKPLFTAAQYAEKLTALGIPTDADDVVTAVEALNRYLALRHADARLLLVSEHVVDEQLRGAGFDVTDDPATADVVVVSFDRTFSYAKLYAAFRAVRENDAVIVATNPDPYCPTPEGGLPDCAAMLAAIEAATGSRAEAIVGKPSTYMAETLLERLRVGPGDLAVVGDRVTTDVALGQNIGGIGILVLTGATSAADASAGPIVPDFVLDGLQQLLPATFRGAAR